MSLCPRVFTNSRPSRGTVALDYIRGNCFDTTLMKPLPHDAPGHDNDLNEPLGLTLSGEDVQLPNKGGIITLLDQNGLKVDGVSYTKKDASGSGWTIVF